MINKRTFLSFQCLFLLSIGCIAQTNRIDSSSIVKVRLDPQTARGLTTSEIFSKVDLIPLETTNESLFGSINSMEVVDDNFVIFDANTPAVLIFKTDGKYIGKITLKNLGIGADQSFLFQGFKIVKEKTGYLIAIDGNKKVQFFDLRGNKVKSLLKSEDAQTIELANGGKIFTRLRDKKSDTVYEAAIAAAGRHDTSYYFPFVPKVKYPLVGTNPTLSLWGTNEYVFSDAYSYDLIKLSSEGAKVIYTLILPAAITLPPSFASYKYQDKKSFLLDHPKTILNFRNPYLINSTLYFTMVSLFSGPDEKLCLAYNLQEKKLISLQDVEPDATSFYLPVTDGGSSFKSFRRTGFLCFNDGNLYSSYSAKALLTFNKANDRKNEYPSSLQSYLKKASENDNPIIVKLKTK